MQKIVVSISGGKDSTAMYLEAMERLQGDFLPVFADTGNEHEITLEYVFRLAERTGGQAYMRCLPLRKMRFLPRPEKSSARLGGIAMTQELLNDGQRLLGAKEAMQYLNNMSKTTFYRNIKRGIIPKQRYLGGTPVWRLEDLRALYDQLPEEPEDTNDPYAVIEGQSSEVRRDSRPMPA